jgi:hypothetical protein
MGILEHIGHHKRDPHEVTHREREREREREYELKKKRVKKEKDLHYE